MNSIAEGHLVALAILLLVTALMEVGVPFPFVLDTALLFVGFQTGLLSFQLLLLIITLFLGRLIGSSAIFWLSRLLGGVFINWLEKRSSSLSGKITTLANKLNRRASVAIAIARFTPGLLTASSVGAGCIRVKYWYFVLGIGLSSLVSDGIVLFGLATGYRDDVTNLIGLGPFLPDTEKTPARFLAPPLPERFSMATPSAIQSNPSTIPLPTIQNVQKLT
jgi:membrane protein DedA with SNARE-associated domain